jgi:hypothetical protein
MSTGIKTADGLRDSIFELEDLVVEHLPPTELEWVHRFTPGMYSREMIVPAGTMITGSIHKTEHISVFLEGEMYIPDTAVGSAIIRAPIVEICQPGAKRVGVTIKPVRWITFHPTDLMTVEECEEAFFTNEPTEVPRFEPMGRVIEESGFAMAQRDVPELEDRADYEKIRHLEDDVRPLLLSIDAHKGDIDTLSIKESARHGLGLFTSAEIGIHDIVAPAIKNGNLMEYSRYCNHSKNPNAVCKHLWNGDCDIIAIRDIAPGEEITVDYRVNLRHAGLIE